MISGRENRLVNVQIDVEIHTSIAKCVSSVTTQVGALEWQLFTGLLLDFFEICSCMQKICLVL